MSTTHTPQTWQERADLMLLAAELEAVGYQCGVAAGSNNAIVLGVHKDLSTEERAGPHIHADWILRRSDWLAYQEHLLCHVVDYYRTKGEKRE